MIGIYFPITWRIASKSSPSPSGASSKTIAPCNDNKIASIFFSRFIVSMMFFLTSSNISRVTVPPGEALAAIVGIISKFSFLQTSINAPISTFVFLKKSIIS
ncbi:hypothetical protein ES708_21283 [subsurface metagenome]